MSRLISLTMLAETLRMSVPYVCAAAAGTLSERAGVVNIALEGMLLASALGSVATAIATGSAAAGVAGGVAVGLAFGAAHATVVVRGRVDGIVSGIALNLLAAAGTRFALRALYDSASNSPSFPGFRIGPTGSDGAALLVRFFLDPVTVIAAVAVPACGWLLYRTRFGLRVRAAGENPAAAASVGIDVRSVRTRAVILSGALCAIGGVHLAYDQHRFETGMSGGRGFVALAAVIIAGWRPGRAALACVLFAALDAAQIVLQDEARIPHEIVEALPYVATLVVLASFVRRSRAPAGLGQGP